ncbi:MAG: hypothetical protein DRQ55_15905 [Planctomycetota bacterium]|nr:MAG: hypothetical protein DRQ55_15905 [Planctomycetota bacterium]
MNAHTLLLAALVTAPALTSRPAVVQAPALALESPVALAPAPAAALGPSDAAGLIVSTVPAGHTQMFLRDVDGDGGLDLLELDDLGVNLRLLRADGSYAEQPDDVLLWPSEQLGWHLTDVDGDGDTDLALLLDGRRAVLHRVGADGRFDPGELLLEDRRGALPRGRRRVPFITDVDGDGRADVVVPGGGTYRIHLRGDEPTTLKVQMDARVRTDVGDPSDLDGEFEQSVTIPMFRVDDIDGDGVDDLVTQTKDVVQFHLSMSPEPSWIIDLAALRDELPETVIDLDNLLGSVTNRVTWRVVDIDGTPPNDLIISQAAMFRIWRGGASGDYQRPPDLLLKSSGNVLHYLVRDVTDDGLPDLQIIRGDIISLADVVRLLVVPGALDFDVFTYPNEAGTFSKRPAKRSTVRLEIPRLLAFFSELEEMQEQLKQRFDTPARRMCLDGDGRFNDVVDLLEGDLLLHKDAVPGDWNETIIERVTDTSLDGLLETFVLQRLDSMEDGGVWPIDLEDVKQMRLTPGWELRQLTQEREPWRRLKTAFGGSVAVDENTKVILNDTEIEVVDLDGDGVSDVVLSGEVAEGQPFVQLVLVRASG